MIKKLLQYFAGQHYFNLAVTLIIIALGAYSLTKINKDKDPRIDFGEVIVTTIYPGASPEDVELKVTNKIETQLQGISGLKEYDSVSLENISTITIKIDENVRDQKKVKDEIRRAVDRVNDFPAEVDKRPIITEVDTSVFPIIEVGLTGDLSYPELRETARILKKKLEKVEGVSSLEPFSYMAREVKVKVSAEKIKNYNISLDEIFMSIKNQNVRAAGGQLGNLNQEKNIITTSQFKTPMEVGDVIVKSSLEGFSVKVKDLAVVKDDFKDFDIISRIEGKPAITFTVYKNENADVVKTVALIKELLANVQKNLPKGVKLTLTNDVSQMVTNRFNIVRDNGIIGIILCFLVLTLALDFRTSLWVGLGVPYAMFGVILILYVFNLPLDAISLSAMVIVLGINCGDSIIISENIFRHRYELGKEPLESATEGLWEVFWPSLSTITTTIIGYLPMFVMTGIMGKFIFVVPFIICLAVTISMMEATLGLPSHLVHEFKKGRKYVERKWFTKFQLNFSKFLKKVLIHRYVTMGIFLVLLVSSFSYFMLKMNFVLFPTNTAEKIFVRVEYPVSTPLSVTSEKLKELENAIKEIPKKYMASFSSRSGVLLGQHGYKKLGKNYGTLEVMVPPISDRKVTSEQILDQLRARISKIKDYEAVFYEIVEGGPPVGSPISIRIVGPSDALRDKLGKEVSQFLSTIKGVKEIDLDNKPGKEEIHISLNKIEATNAGLSASQIGNTVRMAYDGAVATNSRFESEDVDYRILLQDEARGTDKFIQELLVANNFGNMIPLKKIANFSTYQGVNEIKHYKGDRALTVTANLEQNTITPLQVIEKVLAHFDLAKNYPEMSFEIGGEAEETGKSINSLIFVAALAILGIYFNLLWLFRSAIPPLYVLISLSFGLIGVILAFAVHSEPLSFIACLGVIGLTGVVVNDPIVLVDLITQFRRRKVKSQEMIDLIVEATTQRLRSIMLTTLTTVAGLLPLAYGIGGMDPFMTPMALALGYGLLIGTILTVTVIPSVYLIGDDIVNWFKEKSFLSSIFPKPKDLGTAENNG